MVAEFSMFDEVVEKKYEFQQLRRSFDFPKFTCSCDQLLLKAKKKTMRVASRKDAIFKIRCLVYAQPDY